MQGKLITPIVLAALIVPSAVSAQEGVPDMLDCGSDMREWFDGEIDVDFPTPPPEASKPALRAVGCDPDGEPQYRRFMESETGERDEYTYARGSADGPKSSVKKCRKGKPSHRKKRPHCKRRV